MTIRAISAGSSVGGNIFNALGTALYLINSTTQLNYGANAKTDAIKSDDLDKEYYK